MAIHPSSVKNSFGSHTVLWTLFLPLMTLIFVPMIWPHQSISQSEIAMVESFNISTATINGTAERMFNSLFVATGIMPASEEIFRGHSFFLGEMPQQWIHGVWLMIYKAIWRISVLTYVFFIPLLALCIPAAIDGFCVRARKKYKFESYNPIFFYSSLHTVVFVIGMFVFLPIAPIHLSTNILAALLVGMAAGVWIVTSNFQTGS